MLGRSLGTRRSLACAALLTAGLSACASGPKFSAGQRLASVRDEVGAASWYGERYHGRSTASGERFDMRRATAAHPSLPMPSLVEVTNLENGRTLRVRVNDRMPRRAGRVIDLSKSAAEQLGFVRQGIVRVRLRYVGPAGAQTAIVGVAPVGSKSAVLDLDAIARGDVVDR